MRKPILGALLFFTLFASVLSAQQDGTTPPSGPRFVPTDTGKTVLFRGNDGRVSCRIPGVVEAAHFNRLDVPLKVITPASSATPEAGGLTIQLRSTSQLDGFPAAKAAFVRAASTWQSILTTTTSSPVTIIIDVDFGTTRFGETWPAGVLGSADSQDIGSPTAYTAVRASLVAGASTATEQAIFATLPASSVPTDRGQSTAINGASAPFRALGLIDPVANPSGEQSTLGDPPSIGFNSNFSFDFNPDDGVNSGQIDFVSTAVHEIGHVLGFGSLTGLAEVSSGQPNYLTFLDLFRFRPGIASGNFTTSQRILNTGGTQVFFAGTGEIPLSTGNPDGENGDGQQASHWKDDDLLGSYVGIMDPTLPDGVAQPITTSDKTAFDAIGWKLAAGTTSGPAAPSNLTATLISSSVARLDWVDNSNNETEFRVEASVNGSSFADLGSAAANSTAVQISQLSAASTYRFRIKARNASGDSGYSNEATVTTSGGGGGGSSTCTPSSTVLCIDSAAGDRRFKVSVTYQTSQSGGLSGNAQALSLTSLGVTKGGLFSFFSADNPEMLVKVLNGCGLNSRHWVFITAGTNLGFVTTVTDTKNGTVKTYTNPDLTAAQPVQDTNALATCP